MPPFAHILSSSAPPDALELEVCAWPVAAGFPSPAADHTQERIDLNRQLIRNKEATFLFRALRHTGPKHLPTGLQNAVHRCTI